MLLPNSCAYHCSSRKYTCTPLERDASTLDFTWVLVSVFPPFVSRTGRLLSVMAILRCGGTFSSYLSQNNDKLKPLKKMKAMALSLPFSPLPSSPLAIVYIPLQIVWPCNCFPVSCLLSGEDGRVFPGGKCANAFCCAGMPGPGS